MFRAIDDSWDASTRTIHMRNYMYHIAITHKDDLIAVAGEGRVQVFETLTGHRRATFSSTGHGTSKYLSLAFSPDDILLATGRDDGIIDMWDLKTGGLVSSFEGHTNNVESVAFSRCGTMIASCSEDETVRIWNVTLRDCRCILEGHSDKVRRICWSTMRNEVISGSQDGTIKGVGHH
jgi:WD40 repeat protein